jgi:hypothetical protein
LSSALGTRGNRRRRRQLVGRPDASPLHDWRWCWGAPGGRRTAIRAGLLGFDGSMQLVDPVDDVRVRLDEFGSCSSCVLELDDLSGEPGPLALEKPRVRFGCLLPGTSGCLQRGSAALETFTAAVPGEEPKAGILGTAEVSLVRSAGRLKVLVAGQTAVTDRPGAAPRGGVGSYTGSITGRELLGCWT